jgi:hypothetical protein
VSFKDDVHRFADKVDVLGQRVHERVCDLVFESIVEGSAITGAPGQPVQTGLLKGSWQRRILGPLAQMIVTNLVYAQPIEDGIGRYGPLTLRSQVGGFHSVKLTRAGWPRVVAHAVHEVAGA